MKRIIALQIRVLTVVLATLLLVPLGGCSLFKDKPTKEEIPPAPPEVEVMRQFEEGSKLLDQADYKSALRVFNKILEENPVTPFDLVVTYNVGLAHEYLKRCQRAANNYRKVIRGSAKSPTRLHAQAMFRLSYAYECLGQDSKVVTSLLDVQSRKEFLPEEITEAEVPARLAAAYARLGSFNMAQKFYKQAEAGVRELKIRLRDDPKKNELLAKTLYLMGRIDSLKADAAHSQSFLRNLKFLQGYLLKSAAMDSGKWSQKSVQQIVEGYDQAVKLVRKIPLDRDSDAAIARRKRTQAQVEAATIILANIEDLKKLRFPDPNEPVLIQGLYTNIGKKEKRVQAFLAKHTVVNELTPEAQKRQGLRREGRVIGPKTVLEKKPRRGLPKKKIKDPNL